MGNDGIQERFMLRIKVCGITNFSDAIAAAELGADAIGFIFAKSPRRVSAAKVKRIVKRLPPFISKVGVFVNEKASIVNKIVSECQLDLVQLHGEEPPAYLRKMKVPVIKAFRVKDRRVLKQLKKYKAKAFLLDTHVEGKFGGTGKSFDWGLARTAKKFGRPIILSGGLNPKNVSWAIRKAKPYAVDVSSGVEKRPGKKSKNKLKAFIHRVKSLKNQLKLVFD